MSGGASFRSRIPASPSGNMRVIQMRDLGDDNLVHLDEAARIELSDPKSGYLVRAGDIIFRSRGQTYTAALLRENVSDTIVAAPLFLVRANTNKVLPEYLLWWINQASSQSYLASAARGTALKMISKQVLEDLEVSLPSLEEQSRVVRIFSLSSDEQQLLEELKELRALYVHGILMQMASRPGQILPK